MSADVTITQKGLFKKTLPLSVLLGESLRYGRHDYAWRLEEGALSESGLVAYLPQAIGRGISVTWGPQERSRVELRLLTPTGREELRAFYGMVRRILGYWNAELSVEGERTDPAAWLAGEEGFAGFNASALRSACQALADGEEQELTMLSASWPLTLGREEAERFLAEPAAFDRWLHEKQSLDVYYARPGFFQTEDGETVGRYGFTEDCRSVFPLRPSVPFGVHDTDTGRPLVCENFRVALCSSTEDRIIGDVSYEDFLSRLPGEKVSRFDEGSILIENVDLQELRGMV